MKKFNYQMVDSTEQQTVMAANEESAREKIKDKGHILVIGSLDEEKITLLEEVSC